MYLQLTVGSGLAINGAFDLSIITDSLPNLVKLVVGPDPFSPPSENWTLQYLSSEPPCSRVEFVDIKSARLATSAVRMLFKMPSLKTVQLRFCSMSNRAEVSTLLHQIQCDSSGEYPTSISDLCILMSEVEQEWPIDFLLSVLDAMKHLSLLRIKSEREAVRRFVVERYPHLKLKFETVTPLNTPVPEHMQQPAEAEEPPIHPEPVDQPV
ncbi:hypothetical protein GQ42DRAFT_62937 [Ramicandelaber brevisporus]|nr:hypothetical protein GQ42DRAFT_62937 [Ramicandelaber brevisporus]